MQPSKDMQAAAVGALPACNMGRVGSVCLGMLVHLLELEDAIYGQRHAWPQFAHAPEGVQKRTQERQRPQRCLLPPHFPCTAC